MLKNLISKFTILVKVNVLKTLQKILGDGSYLIFF